MESVLSKLISEGKYSEAEETISKFSSGEQRDVIISLAYDSESIAVYCFLQYMYEKYKTKFWLELTIQVMANPLCFIEGAYSIALFHSRVLLEMELSVENLENILFYHDIPEKLVDDNEAELIAKKLIEMDPDNKAALEVLKKISLKRQKFSLK